MTEPLYVQLSKDMWVLASDVQGVHRVDAQTTNVFLRGGGMLTVPASLEHVLTQMRRAFNE